MHVCTVRFYSYLIVTISWLAFMCMYVYICMHVFTCIHMHTYMYMYTYIVQKLCLDSIFNSFAFKIKVYMWILPWTKKTSCSHFLVKLVRKDSETCRVQTEVKRLGDMQSSDWSKIKDQRSMWILSSSNKQDFVLTLQRVLVKLMSEKNCTSCSRVWVENMHCGKFFDVCTHLSVCVSENQNACM
jgi:hypothetical protein